VGKARQGKVDTSGDAEQVHGRIRAHQERDYEEHLGTQARRCCRVPYGSLGYRRDALGTLRYSRVQWGNTRVLSGTRRTHGMYGARNCIGSPISCISTFLRPCGM
jgi:hypothetical protein